MTMYTQLTLKGRKKNTNNFTLRNEEHVISVLNSSLYTTINTLLGCDDGQHRVYIKLFSCACK